MTRDNILQARNHSSHYLSRVFHGKTVTLWCERLSNVSSKENLPVGNPLNYKGDGHAIRTMDSTRYSILCGVTRAGNCIVEKASLSPTGLFSSSLLSPIDFSVAHLDHLISISCLPTMLLQSARLANVASRDEMELQERRILGTSFSRKMHMSTEGGRDREKERGGGGLERETYGQIWLRHSFSIQVIGKFANSEWNHKYWGEFTTTSSTKNL